MVAGDDRRHRQLHRQQGGRGALPRRHRRHRCRDRRHDSGGDETSERLDPQRAACRPACRGQHPRQHQACDLRRPERAARRHLRHDLGAADASRPAGAGCATARQSGSTCSRNMRAGSRRSGCRRAASQSRGPMAASISSRKIACSSCSARPIATRPAFADPDQIRHHPRHRQEHRVRRRPALLRRRLGLARDGRRRGAARHLCAAEGLAARRCRAGADRRLGVSRAAEFAGEWDGG